MLWCQRCKVWVDRDVNATLNLSRRGLARFASSLPQPVGSPATTILLAGERGLTSEAVKGNGTQTLILRVDASKFGERVSPDA
jgi:transposase